MLKRQLEYFIKTKGSPSILSFIQTSYAKAKLI